MSEEKPIQTKKKKRGPGRPKGSKNKFRRKEGPWWEPGTRMGAGAIARVDWHMIKEDWIHQNLIDPSNPYTLRTLADRYGYSLPYVREKCATEKWQDQLEERRKTQAYTVSKALEKSIVLNEIEARVRQVTYARTAQAKAMLRLRSLDPSTLSTKEAIDLLRLGLQEERKALGMAEVFDLSVGPKEDGISFGPDRAKELLQVVIDKVKGKEVEGEVLKTLVHDAEEPSEDDS